MLPGEERRVDRGHPWAYANELALDAACRAVEPGSVITLAAADGRPLGSATFNLHSLIAARVFSRRPGVALDAARFAERLAAASALRERLIDAPCYRLVHAEGDRLPGLVVDRYDREFVVQCNTAGMERATPALLDALEALFRPRSVVLRNDSPVRTLEGLALEVRVARGDVTGPVELEEGGCRFLADLVGGQKTGWFFDQAPARAEVARIARDGELLDLYCHTGGFAIRAAHGGARAVLGIDGSEPALELAREAARLNGVAERCSFEREDAFSALARLAAGKRRFDVVVADPPSFVRGRRELGAGLRGYRKLAAQCARLVAPGGFLFLASCSHHVERAAFERAVALGLGAARREGRILYQGGAGPDHPVHPSLPEGGYLKYLILQLDARD
jgi:23S rRNA (cytosine1962-C5)-methyltransferase